MTTLGAKPFNKLTEDMLARESSKAFAKSIMYRSYVPFIKAIFSLGAVTPNHHAEILEHAARDTGLEGWSCPAFTKYSEDASARSKREQEARATAEAQEAKTKENDEETQANRAPPSCDKRVIAAFVKRHLRAIQECYQRELRSNLALRGRIALRFTIGPDGRVDRPVIEEDTLHDQAVIACVRNTMQTWIFPIRDTECPVVYPFVFAPAE